MRLLLTVVIVTIWCSLSAQLPTNETFDALTEQLGIRINHPLNADFQLRPSPENDYLADQLTIRSKAEKLEMRFFLLPENENSLYYRRPSMRASMLVMNLASNEEDAVTTVHSFDEDEMAVLNADWARMWTFRPKRSFSQTAHAQLIASYRVGRGLTYTVLLFNKAPDTIEGRQLMLRWKSKLAESPE